MVQKPLVICPLPGCGELLEYNTYNEAYFCPLCGRFYTKADFLNAEVAEKKAIECSTSE